jgi:hypothetical protein
VACPYFIPAVPHERELWPHRERLPLGDGFAGRCGACSADAQCDDETVRSQCNLGYAVCKHLPTVRAFDAVRFQVQSDSATLRIQFACELAHAPASAGELRYDRSSMSWIAPPDDKLLHLAEAVVRAWIGRHSPSPATQSADEIKD